MLVASGSGRQAWRVPVRCSQSPAGETRVCSGVCTPRECARHWGLRTWGWPRWGVFILCVFATIKIFIKKLL